MIVLLICLAAVFKAFADTLDHHFDTSIFKNWNRLYFDPNAIHKTGPQVFGYPLDGWHIANSLMIGSFLLLPFFYRPHFVWWVELGIGGTLFVSVFNLCYNKLFR